MNARILGYLLHRKRPQPLEALLEEPRLRVEYRLGYVGDRLLPTLHGLDEEIGGGYALADGSLVLLKERSPSFTHLDRGSELFRIITMPCRGSYAEFCRDAKQMTGQTTGFIDSTCEGPDLIYISCLPWLDMTAITNEHDMSDAVRDDSIPRIAWGRIKTEGEKKHLNISVEVNHRFIDGVHIGMLAQKMEKMISAL